MAKRINIYSTRLVKESAGTYNIESKFITCPQDAVDIANLVLELDQQTKEHFIIFTLNTKMEVAGVHTIHIGTLNSSIVHPRDIFQPAILNNASAVIGFHNHPSGFVESSKEDDQVTKRLVEVGKLVGIDFIDHIIVGNHTGNYFSYKEEGRI